MVTPLRPGSNRALAQPYVQRAVREGVSADALQAQLRAQGIGYRRQDLLSDRRYFAGAARQVDALKSVRRDFLPSADVHPTWHGTQIADYRYQVRGTITFRDGSTEDRTITLESRRPLSITTREREFQRSMDQAYDVRTRGGEVDQIDTIGAWRRAS